MRSWIALLVVAFTPSVVPNGESLLVPCTSRDLSCLSRSTERFLESTSNGIPGYDIRAIDPLIIPALDVEIDRSLGIVFRFRNLNITGLKKQQISDFQMDLNGKSVVLKTKASLRIIGDIAIDLTKDGKIFNGVFEATSNNIGTARYKYNLITDNNDVVHFDVGPESITCEAIDEPVLTLNKELQDVLANDPTAINRRAGFIANRINYNRYTICKIVEEAYKTVVHNIRASAKFLPASSFIADILIM